MTPTRLLFFAAVAAFASACNSAPVVSPSASSTATPNTSPVPSSSISGWKVVVQTIGNTGPDFCIFTARVGMTFTGDYTVTSNGTRVSLTPADPVDWESYTGMFDGMHFDATNLPVEFGPNMGMCAHYLQASRISGTFAPDNNSFTATETWSFTLDSGLLKTVTFSWVGTRR